MTSLALEQALARVIPKDVKIIFRHVASPPTSCPPLFSPPPNASDEQTDCEHHFFTVSIISSNNNLTEDNDSKDSGLELFVFSIELMIYTTSTLTTVFVSKADSTGYLYLLNQASNPSITSSLIRNVSNAFLSHLIRLYQRPGIRLVLSLFARAQSQYLFPGSVENAHKHILDDRGLVKWWCRVVDPILRSFVPEKPAENNSTNDIDDPQDDRGTDTVETSNESATAYLIVPGCDTLETKNFFPSRSKLDPRDRPRWVNRYPLHQICANPDAPPRCLVPRFPDDPKARFLLDLDYEISDYEKVSPGSSLKYPGQWRSVKTLDQFWEMMAFRQECGSGRLVGFLWMVVNPSGVLTSDALSGTTNTTTTDNKSPLQCNENQGTSTSTAAKSQVETQCTQPQSDISPDQAIDVNNEETTTLPCTSSKSGPIGLNKDHDTRIRLSNEQYENLADFLPELDFANREIAISSTELWLQRLSSLIGRSNHGHVVIGEAQSPPPSLPSTAPSSSSVSSSMATDQTPLNVLDGGLVRKRKRAVSQAVNIDSTVSGPPKNPTDQGTQPVVNVLSAGLLRKKKKKAVPEE